MKNKLRKIIREIIEEEYPSSFDMDFFKSLSSFRSRVEYCKNLLQYIKGGSSRKVYKINEDKVLKLAFNKKGIAQNKVEVQLGNDSYINYLFTKIYDFDPNFLWIEAELAQKVNYTKFKEILGYSFQDFADALQKYNPNSKIDYSIVINKETEEAIIDSEFFSDVMDLMSGYKIPVGDLTRISSYGIVKRNGEEDIVIVDYGLNQDVQKQYYNV